jgi:GNAT superfamily N-acetyltransferase
MANELDIGFYQPGDEEGILDLFHRTFPKIPREMEDWLWEYQRNPFASPLIALARANGKVVGQEAYFAVPMKASSSRLIGGQSVDTMVDPICRGQGVFKKLVLATFQEGARRKIPLYYGFPNRNSYHGYIQRFGWVEVGKVARLLKVLDLGAALQARLPWPTLASLIGTLAKPLLWAYFSGRGKRENSFSLEPIQRFEADTDRLWQSLRERYSYTVEKESAYLNWRYLDHPSAGYKAWALRESSTLRGFAITRTVDLSYRLGSVGELFVESWDPRLATIFLTLLLDQFRREKAAIVASWLLMHSPLLPSYRNNGFRVRSLNQPLIAYSPDGSIDHAALGKLEDWYITSGDYDMF